MSGTWLIALCPLSRKIASDDKEAIGILACEVVVLMSKVVNLWHSVSDREVMNLKEWIINSFGSKCWLVMTTITLWNLHWMICSMTWRCWVCFVFTNGVAVCGGRGGGVAVAAGAHGCR